MKLAMPKLALLPGPTGFGISLVFRAPRPAPGSLRGFLQECPAEESRAGHKRCFFVDRLSTKRLRCSLTT